MNSLRDIGAKLANIAYKLAQDDRLPSRTRALLDETRKEWDAAVRVRQGTAAYAAAEFASWEPAMRRPSIWTYGWVHSELRDAWADSLRGMRYVPPQLDWSDSAPPEGGLG